MSTKYGGYMGNVLKIDIKTGEVSEYPWTDEDRELYLGGKIMAAKILYDCLSPNVEPFSEDNLLVITTGPLTGTGAPMSSRFNISTVSPLTGLIASSNCGGDFGIFLKKAGYDGLIIKGKAQNPTWIEIVNNRIMFHDVSGLWGQTTGETQTALGNDSGKLVIGPAGEHLVKYANIFSQGRAAGRAGVGAVMGSKNIKAITAYGIQKPSLVNEGAARNLHKVWVKMLLMHPLTGERLKRLGTSGLIRIMQSRKVLATRNFQYGQFSDFEMVSGETLAKKYLIKNQGCVTCPIKCGRQVEVHGKKVKGPELETIGLWGPNIQNNNLERIMEWNLSLDELGMDAISTAGTIAFCMELQEKGLWKSGLEFGKTDNLAQIVEDIAFRRGIGNELAEGVRSLAKNYGGAEFAMHTKGMELSAYEPRSAVGQGLGYAVSNRGACHLNAGYMVLFEGLGLEMDPYTTKSKAELTITFQDLMEVTSAGGSCLFSLYAIIPSLLINKPENRLTRVINRVLPYTGRVVHMINKGRKNSLPINLPMLPHPKAIQYVTGLKMNFGRFRMIGERGYNLERLFNLRRGSKADDDSLPKRLTDELLDAQDSRTKVPLEVLKKSYYCCRGWNPEGIPTETTLRRLKL